MAALEKIRKKSVMLLIVIGVALLAFIIGDFLNSGSAFFGTGTTVAKVDGHKISIQDFQKRYEEYNQRLQEQGQKVDGALVQNQVLNDMINEQLLNEEVEALNIEVTGAELTEAMTGASANPAVVQFARQMGMESPAQLHDLIFNPSKYGATAEQVAPVQAQWLQMENDIEKQLKYQKLGTLLAGSIQANDLDKSALLAEMSQAATVDIANVPYATIDDKAYPVSEDELKARYDKEKEQFKNDQEIRKIHYIAVNIAPSASDLAKAQKLMNTAVEKLRTSQGVDAIRNLSDLNIEEQTVRASDLDPETRKFVESAAVEGVSTPTFAGDIHKVVKLLGKKMDVDSVNVSIVQVQGNKAKQDSVLKVLASGKKLAEVVNNQTVGGQDSTWMSLMQVGKDQKSLDAKAKILGAKVGEYFVLESTANGASIFKVNQKHAAKQVYDIAQVSLQVFPSDATIDGLRDNLQKYINKNNTGKAFIDNAVAAGYQAVEATITAEDPQINRIESTRKMIQWAFGAETGSVSSIFDKEGNDKMMALTLDEIIPEGYVPLSDSDVRSTIETEVRNDKKAEALIAKYKGKANNIAGYAKLMNVPVDTAVVVTFSQDFIPAMRGIEPVLNGQAPYAKQGTLSGPVKGKQGVFVYKVNKIEKSKSQMTPEQMSQRYAMTFGGQVVTQMALDILKENKKVENNLIKFY